MAQRVEVRLEDDVDQGSADETVRFSLDGVAYEIDLSISNADRLRGVLDMWVRHARRVRGHRARRVGNSGAIAGATAQQVRSWAAQQGIEVNSRGRVPVELLRAYAETH